MKVDLPPERARDRVERTRWKVGPGNTRPFRQLMGLGCLRVALSQALFPGPLNECRSRNSGDTTRFSKILVFLSGAQRRPESKLRRHIRVHGRPHSRSCPRSTKAGVETPATRSTDANVDSVATRSTKAGVETPATPGAWGCWRRSKDALNKGRSRNSGDTTVLANCWISVRRRSTKAGVETPATLGRRGARHRNRKSLNKGRSRNSGDTCLCRTRASARPALNKGRSRNSGDTSARVWKGGMPGHAQQRPESKLRRHRSEHVACDVILVRSTKAGVETPATRRATCTGCRAAMSALNKGRSRNSGDTSDCRRLGRDAGPLNKGRSRNSGDTRREVWTLTAPFDAQQRPESKLRRHLSLDIEVRGDRVRAQQRPESKLRRHSKSSVPS